MDIMAIIDEDNSNLLTSRAPSKVLSQQQNATAQAMRLWYALDAEVMCECRIMWSLGSCKFAAFNS
jgi:hypothetical protein